MSEPECGGVAVVERRGVGVLRAQPVVDRDDRQTARLMRVSRLVLRLSGQKQRRGVGRIPVPRVSIECALRVRARARCTFNTTPPRAAAAARRSGPSQSR